MNTTTFTIESVHGVKQTLILGISGKATDGESISKEISAQCNHEAANKGASGSAASQR